MKKIIGIIFAVFFLITSSNIVYADNATDVQAPAEAVTAATDSIETVKAEFRSNYSLWGFSSAEEVESLILGEGRQLLYADADKLKTAKGDSIYEYVDEDKEMWLFTLETDDAVKGLIWIYCDNGEYRLSQYSGVNEDYECLNQAAEKIADENGLTVSTSLFNNFGTNNIILQGSDKEYIVPIESYAMEKQSSDYTLDSVVLNNDEGYVLGVNEFTGRLKAMYGSNGVSGNIKDNKYGGISIYNFATVDSESAYPNIILAIVVFALVAGFATMGVAIAVSRRKKHTG